MNLDIKTFKFKIFAIFLIPAISIVYYTFYYVKFSDSNIEVIKHKKYEISLVEKLIDVIHHLQIERALSVGMLNLQNDKTIKKELLSVYKKNDETIKTLELLHHNKDLNLQNLQSIRKQVLSHTLSFQQTINLYTQINNNIINIIKYLLPKLDKERYDALFLINLELLKENAGLERAFIYYELMSQTHEPVRKDQIVYLQNEQKSKLEDLLLYSDKHSLATYEKYVDKHNKEELERLRALYKNNQLTKKDAKHWFQVSSNCINAYNKVSKEILNNFSIHLDESYNNTLHNLNVAIILWVFSVLSAIYFIYLIHKLFEEHEQYTDDLELSSRTLDSYEGVVITDKDTRIIKVNKGFERITGFSIEEAIGKKTSILKSEKNPKSLYKAMWGSLYKTGSWTGEVLNKRKDGKIYSQRLSISVVYDKNGEVKYYIGHLFDITELRKAQQEALYQASHDSLTGLINRKYLLKRMQEELSRSKRHDFQNAFLFIDLDNFKLINDTYGHHIGDQLLQHVANSIKNSIRACDIVARISGDEFAVVLLDIDRGNKSINEAISFVADKILLHLNNEIVLEGNKIKIGSSIGVRLFPINQHDNEDQIIKDADTAMYEAKKGGKNRFVIFQG